MVDKVLVEVAIAGEVCAGGSPEGGVRVVAVEVVGDGGAGEEPDFDGGRGALHGVDAAEFGVERGSWGEQVLAEGWVVEGKVYVPNDEAEASWMPHPALLVCPAALTSQFFVCTVPVPPVPVIVHPADVCRDIRLRVWSLIPSMMSISPLFGQFSPKDQNDGQLPHVLAGMCMTSRMKRPRLYVFLLSRRRLARPLGAAFLLSTFR